MTVKANLRTGKYSKPKLLTLVLCNIETSQPALDLLRVGKAFHILRKPSGVEALDVMICNYNSVITSIFI